jgi:uncharacterized protein (UPF0332 family)
MWCLSKGGNAMAQLKPKEILERAKEFLHCADYAAQKEYYNACAICAYAALFWAARAALSREGFNQEKWEHGELHSKFKEEAIDNRKRYPPNYHTWLVNAFVLRNRAQYHFDHPKVKTVRRMVNHVRDFTKRVEEVLNK